MKLGISLDTIYTNTQVDVENWSGVFEPLRDHISFFPVMFPAMLPVVLPAIMELCF